VFCRIEILKRDERTKRVVAKRCAIGRDISEIEKIAGQVRRKLNADGYRMRDLHTNRTEVVWD